MLPNPSPRASEESEPQLRVSRRVVLAGAGFVPLAALVPNLSAQQAATPVARAFTATQLKTLEGFIDRLIPADETGPGALDAGAQNYIDIQLAGYLADEKAAFVAGLEELDAYARKSRGGPFAELSAAKRDEILTLMEANKAEGFANGRTFFNRARRLTLEGMFGDPHYGGNKNGVGWDLIRYPGPRPAVGAEQQRMDRAPTPYRQSAWGAEHEH